MNVGDLLGSGTISGPEPDQLGSLLEQTANGKRKIKLQGGEERAFLEDGDTIVMRGVCGNEEDGLVGFGECVGTIVPALEAGFWDVDRNGLKRSHAIEKGPFEFYT